MAKRLYRKRRGRQLCGREGRLGAAALSIEPLKEPARVCGGRGHLWRLLLFLARRTLLVHLRSVSRANTAMLFSSLSREQSWFVSLAEPAKLTDGRP